MAQNWLIAVDDSIWSSYAFNYVCEYIHKDLDHLYIMHVCEEPTRVFVGYAAEALIQSLEKVEEEKSRKILVHYGRKAKAAGVKYTMMKGTDSNPGALLCRASNTYSVDHLVLGRRGLGSVERFFVGSTSKYCVENADCNVVIVKCAVGPEEEHESKAKVIKEEEHERIRRIEEEISHDSELEKKKELEKIIKSEEEERRRRIGEEGILTKERIDSKIKLYKFLDDGKHVLDKH